MTRKRSISIQYEIMNTNPLSEAELLLALTPSDSKKLRRLPHVFSKVLQLPLCSDADVSVEEWPHCFRFVADAPAGIATVEASTFRLHPGITKLVVRDSQTDFTELSFDEFDLHLDVWRFRLPESTCPEMATAILLDGQLIVTVPKHQRGVDDNRAMVDAGTFVLVN
ncbi:hypothetical protein HN51_069101 [Arachis hypogaea]|uniref:SHSP domain-containing protein n=1 Tax=Arachis hypogaea TaxID=3818 RepID=A0A444Z7P6_ARAHY|nr:uncharacterized protein LOC107643243 [Arachis ipaensis]XP_025654070.1 uncharacterized protein LOC112749867 [Arachis hypogaea]QHO11309.1 uncharacterized protein DS421_15g497020 [Arachis hypogaea]RYR10158.1 hypothetical protein Ahy_B05g078630 [Arachis hypogaea]